MPQLSIIIINYNTFELTAQCIQSLQAHLKGLSYEIILVDNASRECDPQVFVSLFPTIRLVHLRENVGFGRGNNAGMNVAEAPVYLLLNSDTIVFSDAIEKTYAHLTSHESYGIVGCKLLNEDGTVQLSSSVPVRFPYLRLLVNANPFLFRLTRLFTGMADLDHVSETLEHQKRNYRCEWLSGAFMMVKREVVEQCGDFDPDFFMYCEDSEWCSNRISKKFEVRFFAEAAVIHLGGRSSGATAIQKQTLLSTFLYAYKTGKLNYLKALLIYAFNWVSNLIALPLFRSSNRKIAVHYLKAFVSIFPRLLFDIPFHSARYGSRKNFLIIDEYRRG